jgi:hypothetical protein
MWQLGTVKSPQPKDREEYDAVVEVFQMKEFN